MTKFVQIWVSLLLFWVCLCFCFFGENVKLFVFMGFFVCVFFLKKNTGFMGLLEIELVTGFIGLFLRFISCFSGFDGVDLDLGFAGDWFISWI